MMKNWKTILPSIIGAIVGLFLGLTAANWANDIEDRIEQLEVFHHE